MANIAEFNDRRGNLDRQSLENNGRVTSPVVTIGEGRFDQFTRLTDNSFVHHIKDKKNGDVIAASSFSMVYYTIYDYDNDTKLRLTLGDGITVVDDGFLVEIPADRIKFAGVFEHKFTVDNLPHSFIRDLRVI